jgi:hypothetical protein
MARAGRSMSIDFQWPDSRRDAPRLALTDGDLQEAPVGYTARRNCVPESPVRVTVTFSGAKVAHAPRQRQPLSGGHAMAGSSPASWRFEAGPGSSRLTETAHRLGDVGCPILRGEPKYETLVTSEIVPAHRSGPVCSRGRNRP